MLNKGSSKAMRSETDALPFPKLHVPSAPQQVPLLLIQLDPFCGPFDCLSRKLTYWPPRIKIRFTCWQSKAARSLRDVHPTQPTRCVANPTVANAQVDNAGNAMKFARGKKSTRKCRKTHYRTKPVTRTAQKMQNSEEPNGHRARLVRPEENPFHVQMGTARVRTNQRCVSIEHSYETGCELQLACASLAGVTFWHSAFNCGTTTTSFTHPFRSHWLKCHGPNLAFQLSLSLVSAVLVFLYIFSY